MIKNKKITKNRFGKLGTKLILGALLPALIVLIMTGFISVIVLSQNKIGTIKQDISEAASYNDRNVYTVINSIRDILDMNNGHNTMYNYINNYDEDVDKIFYDKAINVLRSYFDKFSKSEICSAWLADFDDRIMISNVKNDGQVKTVTNFGEYDWYNESKLKIGDAYYSGIYTSKLNDSAYEEKVLSIVCPIVDWREGNRVIGAFGVDVPIDYLNTYLNIRDYKDVLIIICDKDYNVLYSRNSQYKNNYESLEYISKSMNGNVQEYVNYNHKNYMVINSNFNSCKWNVLYLINNDEVISKVSKVIIPVIVIILASCFVITFILLTFIYRFMNRINTVTQNTLNITKGDYDSKMSIESDDEFGQLAIAYNGTIDHLKYKAEHDEITNVYNITTFYEKVTKLLNESDLKNTSYAIVRLDIDHFRVINDIYNWQIGNDVLKHIAKSIMMHVPEDKGIVGRMSADLFVICLNYCQCKSTFWNIS